MAKRSSIQELLHARRSHAAADVLWGRASGVNVQAKAAVKANATGDRKILAAGGKQGAIDLQMVTQNLP
jgi:hypothetical protein